MKIVDAEWGPKRNMLFIECSCGRRFKQRSDRWHVVCPKCTPEGDLAVLREEYVDDKD